MSISLNWSCAWYDLKDENNLKLFTDIVSKEFGESMGYLFFNVEYPIRVKATDVYNNVMEFEDCHGNLYCTPIKHYHRQYFKRAKNPNFQKSPQQEVKEEREPSLEELVDMMANFTTIRVQGVVLKDSNQLRKSLINIRNNKLKELHASKKNISRQMDNLTKETDKINRTINALVLK